MSHWYCAQSFEVPLDIPIEMRGKVLTELTWEDDQWEYINRVKITEWRPLDGTEPKPKGEENE